MENLKVKSFFSSGNVEMMEYVYTFNNLYYSIYEANVSGVIEYQYDGIEFKTLRAAIEFIEVNTL